MIYADKFGKAPKVEEYRGIEISSRYCFEHEHALMKQFIDRLEPLVRVRVERVFCDSKTGSYFIVHMRGKATHALAVQTQRAMEQAMPWRNGLEAYAGPGWKYEIAHLSAEWGDHA